MPASVLRVEVSTLRRRSQPRDFGFSFESGILNLRLLMFDNRIATLEKTQGKFYCASVLKDSRVRT
jgi:hypothetical protein